jgi:O-antigen/teichoic acid export membrane protein
LVLLVGACLIPGDNTTRRIILAYAFALFPFAVLVEFVFQGREEMSYIGAGRVIQYVIYLAVLILLLRRASDILVVPVAFVFGYVIAAAFLIVVYITKYRSFKFRFSISRWRVILGTSIPVGLAVIFNQVTISLPPIVLGMFKTNYAVGIFSAGYKIVFMILVVERVFYYVFFPILSRQHEQHPEKLVGSFNFLIRFLFALTVPIALGGLILAPQIITFIYGRAFVEAAGVLRILLLYFMIVPVNTVFGYGLIAIDQERRFFKVIAITAFMSAVLIMLLGLQFGFYGAAAALLVSESVSIILMRRQLRKSVRFACVRYMWKPIIAALGMALLLYVLPDWNVIVLVCSGIFIYLLVLYLINGFTRSDLSNIKQALAGK